MIMGPLWRLRWKPAFVKTRTASWCEIPGSFGIGYATGSSISRTYARAPLSVYSARFNSSRTST